MQRIVLYTLPIQRLSNKAIEDTIRGFNMIMDGETDDLPEQAFLNVGTIEDAKEKAKQLAQQAM